MEKEEVQSDKGVLMFGSDAASRDVCTRRHLQGKGIFTCAHAAALVRVIGAEQVYT